MLDDINEIIAKHLPSQVGEVLRKRLVLADEADKKIVEQGSTIKSLRDRVNSLEATSAIAQDILKREQALVANEAKVREAQIKLDTQTAVVEARNSIIVNALERDERILGLVFGNNRFKYSQNVQEQVAFPPPPATQFNSCPCPQSAQQSRSVVVEGEGDPPAIKA